MDRLTETKDGHGDTIKYEYNLADQQTKLVYPNTKTVERTYDKAGRAASVKDWLGNTTTFGYDPNSNLTAVTFPAGTGETDHYAYNAADRQTETKMSEGEETLASLAYTRDKDGQVTTTVSKGLPGSENTEYGYDENERLAKAGTGSYEYDPANNPTVIPGSTNKFDAADEMTEGTNAKYAYNEAGERTKTTPTTGPATTYSYDQAGDMTGVARPEEGETPKIEDSYAYNGDGLRVAQTVDGKTSNLAWDTSTGLPLILTDGTNNYIYGPNNLPIEQIDKEEKPLFPHHDQQGSTRLLTDSTGTVKATITYDAYGNLTGKTGTATTPLGYDGQYTDADTGLIDLRARPYDPATAQFLSVDPLARETRALYYYASDNPLTNADPTGREAIPIPVELCADGPAAAAACAAAAAATAIVGGHAIGHVIHEMAEDEEGEADEGESVLRERQEQEADCRNQGKIPTGSKPPRQAFRDLERDTGMPRGKLREAFHRIKKDAGLGPSDDTIIDSEGNVYNKDTGESIGNVVDESHG